MPRSNRKPVRTHYRTATKSTKLPFVSRQKQSDGTSSVHFWSIDPVDNQGVGRELGTEFAAHYLQYLQDNPGPQVGSLLADIAKDIDFNDLNRKGQWFGFFSFLEGILINRTKTMDVFATLDAHNIRIAMSREAEDEYDMAAESAESIEALGVDKMPCRAIPVLGRL